MIDPKASHDFTAEDLDAAVRFIKRTWAELRELRFARVWPDRLRVYDVNGDCFEVRGVGYLHPEAIPLLRLVNAAFDPERLADPTTAEFKEFGTGRRFPWAADRAM